MSELSKKILAKIEKGEVKQKSRWRFVLLHLVMWSLVVLAVFLGVMAVGFILRELYLVEWDLVPRVSGGWIKGAFLVLPYLWIIVLAAAMFLSYLLFRKTENGYRCAPWLIAVGVIVSSVVLGGLLFLVKAIDLVDDKARGTIEFYSRWHDGRDHHLVAPEHGILVGRIKSKERQYFILKDIKGREWQVVWRKKARRLPPVKVKVVVIGEVMAEGKFEAEEVRPAKRR